jgi:5,6-dimethylbenzimidazole synthase
MGREAEFPEVWREGVYAAIFQRRDIRAFRTEALPDAVLARVLNAAHHAGSVGFMQPWNFIVLREAGQKRRIWEHVEAERLRAAEAFSGERREKYLSYRLEGIREAPVNVVVTCDPERNGPAVLGRFSIPETDLFSTCCAIQNLWLAARAETWAWAG